MIDLEKMRKEAEEIREKREKLETRAIVCAAAVWIFAFIIMIYSIKGDNLTLPFIVALISAGLTYKVIAKE